MSIAHQQIVDFLGPHVDRLRGQIAEEDAKRDPQQFH